jgi:beta-lactamase regulating signal transducer with metallopeptidase domain
MTWQTLLDPANCVRVSLTLLHSLWQVALMVAIVEVLSRLWLKRWVERSYLVHVTALVMCLVAVPVTYLWLAPAANVVAVADSSESMPSFMEPAAQGSPAVSAAVELPAATPVTPGVEPVEIAAIAGSTRPVTWQAIAQWTAGLYAAGAALMLIRLLLGMASAERIRKHAAPLKSGAAARVLEKLAAQWRLRGVPALATAERVAVPTVVGLLKPMILLPPSAISGLAPAELELILAHELAHVRRYDMWINLLQRAGEVVLFFNPALWYLSRRIAALREYCCDEFVCKQQGAPSVAARTSYAAALVRIVELAKPAAIDRSQLMALTAAGRSPSELRRRVARLVDEPIHEPLRVSRGGLAVAAALGLVIVLGPGLLRSSAQAPNDAAGGAPAEKADDAKAKSDEPTTAGVYPPPETEADRIVAAARARTFGIQAVPKISFRIGYWNSDVDSMKKLSERSLAMLWKAQGQPVSESMRDNTTSMTTLAWDGNKLLIRNDHMQRSDAASAPALSTQSRYWDGKEGWIGESWTKTHSVYRYANLDKLFDGNSTLGIYLPQCAAAGGRIPWDGPEVVVDEYGVDPKLTRYKSAGTETVAGVECDVYDGPARLERVWIEKSTGFVKAVATYYVHEDVPNYWTEKIREVAGRTFKDGKEYGQWRENAPEGLKRVLSAHWAASHFEVAKVGNLSVFSDFREIASGVHWPIVCERVVVHYNGRDESQGYKYIRGEATVTDFTEKFDIRELAKASLPQAGDPVTDRRYDPPIDYKWSDALKQNELEAQHELKLRDRQEEERKKQAINATPINSVADAIEVLTEGPKVDPTDVWVRAIKYLVDHKEEAFPAVVKQLDAETRDHPIAKLAFALRAMGDKRAVPVLIRTLPKTLLPSRSDFGLIVEDPDLCRFAQQHDQKGKVRDGGNYIDYGRAFREVASALERLTGNNFGEMELNWISRSTSASRQAQQEAQFYKFAKRWAEWWDANSGSLIDDPAYAKANLPPFAGGTPPTAGRQQPPTGAGLTLAKSLATWTVESANEPKSACLIDLDTGRQGKWPVSVPALANAKVDSPELLEWAAKEGFDIVGVTHTPEGESQPLYCIKPLGMRCWKLTPGEHREIGEAMAGRKPYPLENPVELMVPQRKVKPPLDERYSGDAFLFVTREGTAGVLRVTAQVTNTDVAMGAAYSGNNIFESTGFRRGAKVVIETMTEDGPPAGQSGKTEELPRRKQGESTHVMKVLVVDEAGTPIQGARVFQNHVHVPTVLPPNRKKIQIKNQDYLTNEAGEADVTWDGESTDLRIWVSKPNYVPLHAMWSKEIQSDGSDIPEEFRFTMKPGTKIGGIVRDENGRPVRGAKVEIYNASSIPYNVVRSGQPKGIRPVPCAWLAEGDTAIVTDAQGRWEATNVPVDVDLQVTKNIDLAGFSAEDFQPPLRLRITHPDFAAHDDTRFPKLVEGPNLDELRRHEGAVVLKQSWSTDNAAL